MPVEILRRHVPAAKAPGVCQPLSHILQFLRDHHWRECNPRLRQTLCLRSDERYQSGREPKELLPWYSVQQVGVSFQLSRKSRRVPVSVLILVCTATGVMGERNEWRFLGDAHVHFNRSFQTIWLCREDETKTFQHWDRAAYTFHSYTRISKASSDLQ